MRKTPKISAPVKSACGYCRYSSHNQDHGNSIEAQVKAIENYAAMNGYTIVKMYIDEARSGTNDRREQFQQMIEDSGKSIFANVIIHKLDRFARNQIDLLLYQRQLSANGVKLKSVCENIDDSAVGKLLTVIMGGVGEYHSNNLHGEVLKGLKINAEHCKSTGGKPCLGYDSDPVTKQYVLNPAEAEIVRIIFEKYADGVGYSQLLNYLNSMGYRTKRGGCFGQNSMYSILSNEKYTGKYIYNKRQEKDATGRRNPQLKPQEEWIVVPDGIPAIISQELFDLVQAKMSHNAEKAGRFKSKNKYLLSGLVHCGECGYALQGNTRKDGRHGTLYSSYDCSGRKRRNGCCNRSVRKEYLENYVLHELYDKVLSNVSIQDITDRLNDYNKKMAARSNSELDNAAKQLVETERKIARIVTLATETDSPMEVFKAELQKLKDIKVFLESKINELHQNNTIAKIPVGVTVDLLNRSKDIIKSHDLVECQNVITAFVEKVVIYNERVDVVFKVTLPDGGDEELSPITSGQSIEAIRGNNFKLVG